MSDSPSAELLLRWLGGEEEAAQEFLQRHYLRVLRLVHRNLRSRLARRIDPEDVLQSACRSFFVRLRDGRIDVHGGDAFGNLLVKIALCKLHKQAERHGAAKRAFWKEESAPAGVEAGPGVEPGDDEMPPDEVVAFREELAHLLARFEPHHRRMVELYLLGHTGEEIAADAGRTDRLVRKVLRRFEDQLDQRLAVLNR